MNSSLLTALGHLINVPITILYYVSVLTPKYKKNVTIGIMALSLLVMHFLTLPIKTNDMLYIPAAALFKVLFLFSLFTDKAWIKFVSMGCFYLFGVLSEVLGAIFCTRFFGLYPEQLLTDTVLYIYLVIAVNGLNLLFLIIVIKPLKALFNTVQLESRRNTLLMGFYYIVQLLNFYILLNIIYSYHIISSLFILCMFLSFLLSFVLVMLMLRSYEAQARKDAEGKIIKEQLKLQASHNEQINRQYEEMRRIKHDFSSHIQTIEALQTSKDYARMNDYIHDLSKKTEESLSGIISGNPGVDAILYYKIGLAERNGIEVEHDIYFKDKIEISDVDMCSLLSNMLDNAIEGCQSAALRKHIRITVKYRLGMLVIIVTNTCGPTTSNLLDTTKPDK